MTEPTDTEPSDSELTDSEPTRDNPITRCLERWSRGDEAAQEELLSLAYGQLHSLASTIRRRNWNPSRAGTETVLHEGLVKLQPGGPFELNGSQHFFRLAAKAMREALLNLGARATSQKRSPEGGLVALDSVPEPAEVSELIDTLALDQALEEIRERRPEFYEVIVLRGFWNYSLAEAADILGVSERTVRRRWRVARHTLARKLGQSLVSS